MSFAYFYLCLASLVVTVLLFIGTYRNRHKKFAKEFMLALIPLFFALSFFSLSLLTEEISLKYMLHEMKFLGVAFFPVTFYIIYMSVMGRDILLKKKYIAALCAVPVLAVLAALTNSSHNLFRQDFSLSVQSYGSFIVPSPGILFWFYTAYDYAIFFIVLLLFVRTIFSTPRIYRDRMIIMFWSIMFTIIVSVLSVTSLFFVDYGDATLISFTVTAIVQYYAIIFYKPRGMIMRARGMAINEIKSPLIIYDYNGIFLDANAAVYEAFKDVSALESKSFDPETEKRINDKLYSVAVEKMYDDEGFFSGTIVLLNNITKIRKQEEDLKRIVGHDYITGLDNLHAFREHLNKFTENDLPVAVVLFDICAMREINREYGSIYGDEVIREISGLLKEKLPADALCARIGGDEFGILLPNTPKAAAQLFIENVLEALKQNDFKMDYGFAVQTELKVGIWRIFKKAEDNLAKNKLGFEAGRG